MGKMKQLWLLTAVLIVGLLGAGYFFGAKPQIAKAEKVKVETSAQASANDSLRNEIKILQGQADGVIAQENRLRQIAAILPNTPALPRLVRSLSTITEASGVDLISVSPGTPAFMAELPVARAAAPAATTPGGTASASAAPKSAAPKTSAPKSAAARSAAASAGGLASMPVTLTLNADFAKAQLFISKLEKLDRAFVVDTLGVVPAAKAAAATDTKKAAGNQLTVTIVGRVFIKAEKPAAPVKAPAAASTEK